MSSFTEQLCQFRVLSDWVEVVKKSTLFDQIRYYYYAVTRKEPFFISKRPERICYLKKQIKKKLPKHILKPKLFFYLVETYYFFNPLHERIDEEQYFEIIIRWRKTKMKKFFQERPLPRRHKKVIIYKRKPLR